MTPRRSLRGALAAVAAVAVAVAVGPAARSAVAAGPAPWTITVATPTDATPSWAYPFLAGSELRSSNVQGFEQLMYRPLYYFGPGPTNALNPSLSLATPPVYSNGDTTVSFTVRPGLRWSNGEPVSALGVVEWMNLDASFPGIWADYLPPLRGGAPAGIPDDVRTISVAGATVTLSLSRPVDPAWFTASELSQITPLPRAWDLYEPSRPHVAELGPLSISGNAGHFNAPTASAGCYSAHWVGDGNAGVSATFTDPLGTRTVVQSADVAQAAKCVDEVYLLRSLSADTPDYTAPSTDVRSIWGLSDGPWRLATYNASTGTIFFVPNLAAGASGQRAAASRLELVGCAPGAGCAALLASRRVDQGTLDTSVAPRVAKVASAPAHNPYAADGYRESVVYPWSTNYLVYNFRSTLGANRRAGSVFRNLYVRQAFQSVVDQASGIAGPMRGYGTPTFSPAPPVPNDPYRYVTTNPYPFDVAHAAALLSAHGWHVAPGATTTCVKSTLCGAGIGAGTPLRFTLELASATPAASGLMSLLRANAARVGIQVTVVVRPPAAVFGDALGSGSGWDLANWDGGWRYAPGYFPSGEWVFATGSPLTAGGYSDPHTDALVAQSLSAPVTLAAYDAYVAAQLPVMWQPGTVTLKETRSSLKGVTSSPIGDFLPEQWHR